MLLSGECRDDDASVFAADLDVGERLAIMTQRLLLASPHGYFRTDGMVQE